MDSESIGRVALMSIQPQYAQAILRGEKLVELRKRPISNDVTHIIIYATMPVGAIIGAFRVAKQVTANIGKLWSEFGGDSCISFNEFHKYYRNKPQGTGIRIGETFMATEYMNLDQAFGFDRPPQSFQYVDTDCARLIISRMILTTTTRL